MNLKSLIAHILIESYSSAKCENRGGSLGYIHAIGRVTLARKKLERITEFYYQRIMGNYREARPETQALGKSCLAGTSHLKAVMYIFL